MTYQEDVYAYNPANGLYERAERAWLAHAVTQFLAEDLGSALVGFDYVADQGAPSATWPTSTATASRRSGSTGRTRPT